MRWQLVTGVRLETMWEIIKNIIEALSNSKGEMFTEKTSWVKSFNGLNAEISAKFNSENYLVFSKFYDSLSVAQENGIEYALLKYTNINNPNRTHFVRYFNGTIKDPMISVNYNTKFLGSPAL